MTTSILTSNFHLLILFIWIVSVLTSAVNNEARADGASPTSAPNKNIEINAFTKTDRESPSPAVQAAAESVSPAKTSNSSEPKTSIAVEGGPITVLSTTQSVSPVVSHLSSVSNTSNATDIPKTSSTPIGVPRTSTQSKIVPRKGADENLSNSKRIELPLDKTSASNDTKTVIEATVTNSTHINEQTSTIANDTKKEIVTKQANNTSSNNATVDAHVTNVSQQSSTDSLKTSTTTRKPKPKPTVTIGEPGIDKPIPQSPAKTSPLGMPRKIDYIVPVVISVIALPLLAAAAFVMYRQGRDCWDKRHYRRMDFLIDGMYNE